MAVDEAYTKAYATVDEYRTRTNSTVKTAEATEELTAQLAAMARLIEREVGDDRDQPRTFHRTEKGTVRYVDGTSDAALRIDDLVALDANGIAIDTARDGTFTTTFGLAAPWCVATPDQAEAMGTPYTGLELLPYPAAPVIAWPAGRRTVRLTGTWGWPAVPPIIVELNVMLTRQLRDLQQAGVTRAIEAVETQLQFAPGAFPLMRDAKRQYARRVPVIA